MKRFLSLTAGTAIFAFATAAQAQIDVVFKIDESGSMGSAIEGVKKNVVTIYDALPTGSHVGLVGYGAGGHKTAATVRIPHVHTPLTKDKTVFETAVGQLVTNGSIEPGYQAVYESATDTVSIDWQDNPNPSLGFTGAPYCNILITDETPNQGGRTQQEAINAMNARNGVFFGIMLPSLFAETQPLADATGGKLFDIAQFRNDPQPVIDAVMQACVWATSLKANDGLSGKCLPVSSTDITYTLDYGNPNKKTIQGVQINHTSGTWGSSPWMNNVGDLASGASGSATATLPLGTLSPGMKFFNEFTIKSTTPGVPPAIAKTETEVCKNTPPVAKCKDIQAALDANGKVTISPADIDNGSADPDPNDHITLSISKSNFTCSDIGVQNLITLTATDDSGESDSCIAKVTTVDKIAPVVTTKLATVQSGTTKFVFTATAKDNCSAAVKITTDYSCSQSKSCMITQSGNTLTIASSGGFSNSNAWTMIAKDQSGNTKTVQFP